MADDDVAAARARLELLAWGGTASAAEAAAARDALDRLRQQDGVPGGTVQAGAPAPTTGWAPSGGTAAAASASVSMSMSASDAPGTATAPVAEPRAEATAVTDGAGTDHGADPEGPGGGEPRLQDGPLPWRTRARRALRTTRPRVWIGLGVAAAVGVAFAAGTVVGTAHTEEAAAPSVTPAAGTVTLADLLDVPQTYADQLPGPVEAPVSLHSTRVVFTNRSLDGGSFQTPWTVWAGVGKDRSTICLIASANRLESSSGCYPRDDALHGSVSLSAQSSSGTLTVTLVGGAVRGIVTSAR